RAARRAYDASCGRAHHAGHRPPRRWPDILVFCLLADLLPETSITTSTSILKIAGNTQVGAGQSR
ncbi:MAG TPA: hypothetical protein VFQ25_00435, partial [Ktedonobacterales bacterium]|nr:hypothetical protein [Ktedonobacterales bacterium]